MNLPALGLYSKVNFFFLCIQVIASLKEEKFCDMQSSPMSEIVYKKEAEMLAPLAQLSLHS